MAASALRLIRQENRQQNIEQLREQLDRCVSVPVQIREVVEDFLLHEDIFSLAELTPEVTPLFARYLEENHIRNKAKVRTYLYALTKYHEEYRQLEYAELLLEVAGCELGKAVKNKAVNFLMEQGIKSLADVDCEVRERYASYLETNIAKSKFTEYIKGLDRLKLHAIKTWQESHPLHTPKITYQPKKIYLSYLPVYEIAQSFYFTQDKQSLFWDFSLDVPEKLKRQVFHVLLYALENIKDIKDCKVRYLLPLSWLYEYCAAQGIEDLEYLELHQIEGFREVVAGKVVNVSNSMQIIDNARKRLFLDAEETNWNANVWYMERFNLQRERMNPSNPVIRLSFLEVQDMDNRRLLQEYTKYQVGISSRSMSSVRQHYYYTLEYLKYLDGAGIKAAGAFIDHIEGYFREQEERELLPVTYNKKVISVFQFYRFLRVKKHIGKIPFFLEYYLKEAVPVHHDRSVEQDTVRKVLKNLYRFPLILRLMYLNLWCIGLRVNEVCTLKGNAYYWKDNAAWIKIYQNKMRAEKTVPIPTVLYRLMVDYIDRNQIKPGEYIFKGAKGQAYNAGTFVKQMIQQLELCGITCEEYHFKSHDYRHTVATFLYAHGASLQAVRDYLGHDQEEMTMQYVDYVPNMIKEANEEYFGKEENNLMACLKKKGGAASDK